MWRPRLVNRTKMFRTAVTSLAKLKWSHAIVVLLPKVSTSLQQHLKHINCFRIMASLV